MLRDGYYFIKGMRNHGIVGSKWFGMRVEGSLGQYVVLEGAEAHDAINTARKNPLVEMAVGTGAIAMGPMTNIFEKKKKKKARKPRQLILGGSDKTAKEDYDPIHPSECTHCSKSAYIDQMRKCKFCNNHYCGQCIKPTEHNCKVFNASGLGEAIDRAIKSTKHYCVRCRDIMLFLETTDGKINCTKCANPLFRYGFEFVTASGLKKLENVKVNSIAEEDDTWEPGKEFNMVEDDDDNVAEILAAATDIDKSDSIGPNAHGRNRLKNLKKDAATARDKAVDSRKKKEAIDKLKDTLTDQA